MEIIPKRCSQKWPTRYEDSLTFKPNELAHDLNQGTIYPNGPILCTRVHLRMANNVHKGSFHFLCKKNAFSIFKVPKSFFCEAATKKISLSLIVTGSIGRTGPFNGTCPISSIHSTPFVPKIHFLAAFIKTLVFPPLSRRTRISAPPTLLPRVGLFPMNAGHPAPSPASPSPRRPLRELD